MAVNWVLDVNGNYEISSPEHLKQIMHQGSLYTNTGNPPSIYWDASYIQTTDIDFLGDSTDIIPIGTFTDQFLGAYDGAEYKISNWSYIDPEFSTINDCLVSVGLFAYSQQCILKNMRLSGLWTIKGFNKTAGFLCGQNVDTSATHTGYGIFNIEGDFDEGSYIDADPSGDIDNVGVLFGYVRAPYITGLTVKGSIDFIWSGISNRTGGIIGRLYTATDVTLLQNLATFPSGINGAHTGGIIGLASGDNSSLLSKCLNAMIGDISGSGGVGGICGYTNTDVTTDTLVNAMTGDIHCTGTSSTSGSGGIFGILRADHSASNSVNYMTGTITAASNNAAGIVGYLFRMVGMDFNNHLNAMNGFVDKAIIGAVSSTLAITSSNLFINTDFGLTYSSDIYGSVGAPPALPVNSGFTDLPYATLDGTDLQGNTYDFDFVFGNLGGNANYSDHSHLVLHKGDISTPFSVDYDIPTNNTTVYLTFANLNIPTLSEPSGIIVLSISVDIPPFVNTTVFDMNITVAEVSGATGYNITYEGSDGNEIEAFTGSTDLEYVLTSLQPDTLYIIRIYTDTGSGYVLTDELTTSTLANVASNYVASEYTAGKTIVSGMSSVMNDLFTTGDILTVPLPSRSDVKTSFVVRGGTLNISGINGLILPFDETSGSGQEASIVLSDNTTNVPVIYDDSNNSITINSVVYYPGDYLVLDGKKVTIYDI